MAVTGTFESFVTTNNADVIKGDSNDDTATVEVTITVPSGTDVFNADVIGGKYYAPTIPRVVARKTVLDSGAGVDPARTYVLAPIMMRLKNGNILMVYKQGEDHVSINDVCSGIISDDDGETWGPEATIIDNPNAVADNGGASAPNGGVDPVTGRVIIFFIIKDIDTNIYSTVGYKYSDDNAVTWSATVDISSMFLNEIDFDGNQVTGAIPFGRIVNTTRGMMMIVVHVGICWVIYSTDGGLTWGDRHIVFNTGKLDGWSYAEANIVQIDETDGDRFAVMIRSQTQPEFYSYATTADAGYTWTGITSSDTGQNANKPAPITGWLVGGRILICWIKRSFADCKMFTNWVAPELFYTDPSLAWLDTTYLKQHDVNAIGSSIGEGLNVGYPNILEMADNQYTAWLAFYDQHPTLTDANTVLELMSFPRPEE